MDCCNVPHVVIEIFQGKLFRDPLYDLWLMLPGGTGIFCMIYLFIAHVGDLYDAGPAQPLIMADEELLG